MKKIGTFTCYSFEKDCILIKAKLKDGVNLKRDQIITDEMIEEVKDPLWNDIVQVLYNNYTLLSRKNHGQVAEEILELVKKRKEQ